jgi:hypothetical protein
MRAQEFPKMDVLFSCGNDYFAAVYDVEKGQLLSDIDVHKGPTEDLSDASEEGEVAVADIRSEGQRSIIFIRNTSTDKRRKRLHQLQTWRAARGRPYPLGSIDLMSDWVPVGTSISEWLEISHPPVHMCGLASEKIAICTEFLDSIFQIDLKTGRTDVLFYPAGAKRTTDGEGYYAFYARGGFRVFVSRVGETLQ